MRYLSFYGLKLKDIKIQNLKVQAQFLENDKG